MQPWDLSRPDWEKRILSGQTLVPDLPLFETEKERALRFFKRFRLPDLIGKPTRGEVCGPYIYPIIAAIFGSLDPETYQRYIRETFLMVPKGNDKTGTAATVAVTWAMVNQKPEAELVLIAPSKEIASRGFNYAAGIIRADPVLEKVFYPPKDHTKEIEHRLTGASIKVVAADTGTATGGKQTVSIIDETHELSNASQAKALMTEIRGALGKNRDGFMLQITTQSKKPPTGLFRQELDKARAVRDGKLKLPVLPVLYELPAELKKDGGWKNRAFWHLVNPNYGLSIQPEYLEGEVTAAESSDLAAQALLASQHFNVEIGVGLSTDGWAGARFWEKAIHPDLCRETIAALHPNAERSEIPWLQLQALLARCEVVTIGVDGGGLDDLLGITVLGKERFTGRWISWSHAVAAPIALERHKANKPFYDDFIADGDLTIADLPADMDVLDAIVGYVIEAGVLGTVDVDPSCVDDIKEVCAGHGITEESGRFVGERQGTGLMKAIKTAERRLAARTMLHCGQGLMGWCVDNARVKTTAAAMMIEREASGKGKIDPLIAKFDAIMGMTADPVPMAAEMDDIIAL